MHINIFPLVFVVWNNEWRTTIVCSQTAWRGLEGKNRDKRQRSTVKFFTPRQFQKKRRRIIYTEKFSATICGSKCSVVAARCNKWHSVENWLLRRHLAFLHAGASTPLACFASSIATLWVVRLPFLSFFLALYFVSHFSCCSLRKIRVGIWLYTFDTKMLQVQRC